MHSRNALLMRVVTCVSSVLRFWGSLRLASTPRSVRTSDDDPKHKAYPGTSGLLWVLFNT